VPRRPFTRLPILLVASGLALGWGIGGYRLLDPDEGRNAEVAREMLASRDFVVPRLDGLPYLDKPVLYFAAEAVSMAALGATELAARLPAYLFTLGSLVLVVWFARKRWGPEAGWIAGIALATMPLTLAYARTAIFDSTLSFFITAAIVAIVEDHPVTGWVALALGTITKGPVALAVALATLLPWALLTGRPLKRVLPLRGIAAFLVAGLPWFVAVTLRHPEFPHYAFVRETFQRVTTRSFHRTAPFWYYLPILPVAAFPWIVPALSRLSRWREAWRARRVDPAAGEAVLLACWVLGPLAFFTLNQSKLPQYVLPLMPAFALAAARVLARDGITAGWRAHAIAAAVAGALLVSLTRWLPAPLSLTGAERAAIPPAALALGLTALASAAVVAYAAWRDRPSLGILGYAAIVIAIPLAGGRLLQAVGEDRSSASITETTAALLAETRGQVLGVAAYPTSLPFYLRHPIDVASETGNELTSNYVADYQDTFRAQPGSPLKPADYWRGVFAGCPVPTVFITRANDHPARTTLGASLPLLAEDTHYAAYGPCRPAAVDR